ncbi:VCBS domain-containing protein [Candidatus Enterovibrio altilux]|uniref:Hemolysin-type calcium-binding region n=2 Tax=Candidatus Enterovibrio altilux TaxID=1927128 RepID=A0A291BC16_9GAMM|nr:VCBS domain-containing protein [Candidatus Enterovibrio luxaltus]ATF10534.1 Hemolysin-type calcium-binding region [Candidatus Enterovibrio luxaltus]
MATDKPTLTLIGDSEVIEGEDANYTLAISEAPISDLTVTVVVGHKTSEDDDVTPITHQVVIAAGTTFTSFTVNTINDGLNESVDNDVFTLSILGSSGGGFEELPSTLTAIETVIRDDAEDAAQLMEDIGTQSISGVLHVLDSNGLTPLEFTNTTVVGNYGSLTLVNGDWTYLLYPTAQILNEGENVTEFIILTATNGTVQTIVISVIGTEDSAVVTGDFIGSVDVADFSINTEASNNIRASNGEIISNANSAWTTTSTMVNNVPYVIATQWGSSGSTIISRVNNDGTLTETDRITYNQSSASVITTSGGNITADVRALGILPESLGNGLTQSNAANIDGQNTLFVTSQNSSSLTAWNISDSGVLTINGGITNINAEDGQSYIRENITFEGANGINYIYVTRPGTDGISKFTYSSKTGEMVNTNEFVFGGETVSSIDVCTTNDYNSFLAAASNDAVRIFAINQSTGALTLVEAVVVPQGTSNSVNYYHTNDNRSYIIYSNNTSNKASIFQMAENGSLTLTDTIDGAGHYFSSAGYIDGEPVYIMPNATAGVDLYTIGRNGSFVLQTTVANISNDWTPPVIVQTEDSSYYLVDADGLASAIKLTVGNTGDGSVGNEGVKVSGSLHISDIDSEDFSSFENITITGTYGTLVLVEGTWIYTLDKDKSSNILDDKIAKDAFRLTAIDGTTQDIIIDVTGHETALEGGVYGKNTDAIIVYLSPQAASPGFIEESSGDVNFNLREYVADLVDDADLSDARKTSMQIISLPNDGVLYYYNESGDKVPVVINNVLSDETIFIFEPNRASITFSQNDIIIATQTTIISNGITVSGGIFSGTKPDDSSTISPANIVWEFQSGESGIGVGLDREITSSLKEVLTIEFTGSTNVTNADIVVSSAFGNFSDTRSAQGKGQLIAFRDGQVVGEYSYANLWEASGGDGVATLNIVNSEGFNELRLYITANVNSNFSVTSISASGVNTTDTQFTYKAINSFGNESEIATVNLGENIIDSVTMPAISTVSGTLVIVNSTGVTAVFANTTKSGTYGSVTLMNGTWTYTLHPALLTVISNNQSIQDTITLTATDGTIAEVTIIISESSNAIISYYTTIANNSLSGLIDMGSISFLGNNDTDNIYAGNNNDGILSLDGDDTVYSGAGDDIIDLGAGNDLVVGGAGNDILIGGDGEDVFTFLNGNEGTNEVPTIDHIGDFNTNQDALNVTDLLQGETNDTIGQYLNIVMDSQGYAMLNISSMGNGMVDQQVVFDNLSVNDMATAYQIDASGISADQISTLIIDAMIVQSRIIID